MFLALTVLMVVSPASFTQHYFSPHLLTMVHVAALGWGTMIIFGAAHQLLPVICERDLFSEKLASITFYLLAAGVLLLVSHFWTLNTGIPMISGGVLILIAVIAYGINVWKTTEICSKYSVQKLYVLSSSLWLLSTVSMGLLLAINLKYPFFDVSHLEILKLHAHAGFAGWFLQLITGVSSRLVPMFLLGKSDKDYLLKWACVFQNVGLLLFLLDGYFFGITVRVLFYAVIVLAGIALWLFYLYDNYQKRLRKKVELLMKHSFLSFLALVLAVVCLPAVYSGGGYRWTMLYGTLLLMGWITSIILGKTFKTLPFIIWNNHYKKLSGKGKIPLPKDLYSTRLTVWQFWLFIAAIIVFAAGIMAQNVPVIRFGAVLWLAVALVYNVNVFKLILHKTKIK